MLLSVQWLGSGQWLIAALRARVLVHYIAATASLQSFSGCSAVKTNGRAHYDPYLKQKLLSRSSIQENLATDKCVINN